MEDLSLIRPTSALKSKSNDFKQEFFGFGEPVINGSALFDQLEFDDWLIHIQKSSRPETVQPDWVVADTFFAVRRQDNRLIGMIDIRHNLNNAFLSEYGGHIGYAVRPSERRKGYATQMLKLALAYAKSIGLKKVMLGCYADNTASYKTILKCGGILTETNPYADGKPMHIYWITL